MNSKEVVQAMEAVAAGHPDLMMSLNRHEEIIFEDIAKGVGPLSAESRLKRYTMNTLTGLGVLTVAGVMGGVVAGGLHYITHPVEPSGEAVIQAGTRLEAEGVAMRSVLKSPIAMRRLGVCAPELAATAAALESRDLYLFKGAPDAADYRSAIPSAPSNCVPDGEPTSYTTTYKGMKVTVTGMTMTPNHDIDSLCQTGNIGPVQQATFSDSPTYAAAARDLVTAYQQAAC
jgi:hypothetical protein